MPERALEPAVERIVMVAPVDAILQAAQPWPHVRAMVPEDIPWTAAAAWECYPRRTPFDSWDGVVELTQSVFRNEAGEFMPVASPVALTDEGFIAGFVTTVYRCILKDDLPDCPYILDCIVLPDHRRQGVAAGMLAAAARALKAVGEREVALTVYDDNDAAKALYASLGFTEFLRRPASD
ncbi:GNAT family N-acetyltransferase [Demequina gelatinilytica]|uniref:GNAT family N-acetyltransferase n=1 Tax=Demequina gelatinilytica TaxID=1638980 RepID=UPI0009E1F0CE|nr:GNAT family N-acetyltransferase [Demequina gelatinilytica]